MQISTKVSKSLIVFYCFTFILVSCSFDSKKSISKDKFSDVLSELITIESMNISDSLKVELLKECLANNELTINDIQKKIETEKNDSQYWQAVFEKIKTNLKENKE